jgi:hypothetical protein
MRGLFEVTAILNYTTILNSVFLVVAATLVSRFMRTDGPRMLRMMNMSRDTMRHARG